MKARVMRMEFLAAVKEAAALTGRDAVKPILTDVLVEVAAGRVQVKATDLEVGIIASGGIAEDAQAGGIVVSPKLLSGILSNSDEDAVTLEVIDGHLVISANGDNFKLITIPPDDFPALNPPKDIEPSATVPAEKFAEQILAVAYCAAAVHGRYALNGILVEIEGKMATLAATDGRRLAVAQIPIDTPPAQPIKAIFPVRALDAVRRNAAEIDSVSIYVLKNQVIFEVAGATIFAQQIEGRFPPYKDVIPKDQPCTLTVVREALMQAIRKVAVVSASPGLGMAPVVLSTALTTDVLKIDGASAESGEAHVTLDCEFAGAPISITLSATYLLDALKHYSDAESATIEMSDAKHAVTMHSSHVTAMLMPIERE